MELLWGDWTEDPFPCHTSPQVCEVEDAKVAEDIICQADVTGEYSKSKGGKNNLMLASEKWVYYYQTIVHAMALAQKVC